MKIPRFSRKYPVHAKRVPPYLLNGKTAVPSNNSGPRLYLPVVLVVFQTGLAQLPFGDSFRSLNVLAQHWILWESAKAGAESDVRSHTIIAVENRVTCSTEPTLRLRIKFLINYSMSYFHWVLSYNMKRDRTTEHCITWLHMRKETMAFYAY